MDHIPRRLVWFGERFRAIRAVRQVEFLGIQNEFGCPLRRLQRDYVRCAGPPSRWVAFPG